MFRNGKPASRITTNIQKTKAPTVASPSSSSGVSPSSGRGLPSSGNKPKLPPSNAMTPSVGSSSRNVPLPQQSKSPSNMSRNNIHYHFHEDEHSKTNEDAEDDDDMEIMSVNDQPQYMKQVNSSGKSNRSSRNSNITVSRDSSSSRKELQKSNDSLKSSLKSSKSNTSAKSRISDMAVSDDSIPLRLKKKVQIETPREVRESIDSSASLSSSNQDFENDMGENESVTSSSNSLHILSSVRQKLKEDEFPVNNTKPSRMADFIKRFRTAPPTKRSERKRLDVEEEEPIPQVVHQPKSNSIPREDNRQWMKRVNDSSNEHPSIRNINFMKESIKKEIYDVEESIELAKRYATIDYPNEDDQMTISTKDKFSYMDTLDIDINELNNMTNVALENGSFHLFNNVEDIISKMNQQNVSVDSGPPEKKKDSIPYSSSEEDLDEMFRKGVLSRLQSIGLHESYLDIESYDILTEKTDPKEKALDDKLDHIISQHSRDNSVTIDKPIHSENPHKEQSKQKEIIQYPTSPTHSPKPTTQPEKNNSKYEISIDHSQDLEEGFFPVVTIKSDKVNISESISTDGSLSLTEGPVKMEFVDEEELFAQQEKEYHKSPMSESMDSILGKSIQSVSSVSSANDNDLSTMGYCQKMIEQMVSSEQEHVKSDEQPQPMAVDAEDDNNELFTSDYICQTLRQKIDLLKNRLAELEKKELLF